MIRTEESKRLWKLAEAARDWEAMEAIERQWALLAEPIPDYSQDEQYVWEGEDEDAFFETEEKHFWDERDDWTDEDEAGLEEYEERKRQRIAEANEY